MHVNVRGKRWNLVFERISGKTAGLCDPPTELKKKIIIHDNLSEQETLRVICHEVLHAAYWDMDESAIDEASADLAKILWKLGYRR
jgi:hypothetical protein